MGAGLRHGRGPVPFTGSPAVSLGLHDLIFWQPSWSLRVDLPTNGDIVHQRSYCRVSLSPRRASRQDRSLSLLKTGCASRSRAQSPLD